jgi:hypothetical protein
MASSRDASEAAVSGGDCEAGGQMNQIKYIVEVNILMILKNN